MMLRGLPDRPFVARGGFRVESQKAAFGPIDDTNIRTVEATFLQVMSRIGVSSDNSLHFDPFKRGFWAPQA